MNMDKSRAYNFVLENGHKFSGARDADGNGQMHSFDDEPAVVYADGSRWWYREGKIHRDGDKPAIIWSNGVEEWFQNDKRHRDGGPALVYPDTGAIHPQLRGVKQWWSHGQCIKEERP